MEVVSNEKKEDPEREDEPENIVVQDVQDSAFNSALANRYSKPADTLSPDGKGRVASAFLIALFVVLASLTAALPPTDPYDRTDSPGIEALKDGDTGETLPNNLCACW